MIWIIDASVAVCWFLEEEAHDHANEVLKKVVEDPRGFAVSELFAFEVYAVAVYRVLVNACVADGGDGHYIFLKKGLKKISASMVTTDVLADYIIMVYAHIA